jgi:biopolymer transport protein ExbD
MKIRRRKIKRGRVEIIPMIDTIVILLIFYMTFSRFVEASREANLNLPQSRAGDDFRQLEGQVIINMFSAEDISIDKRKYSIDEALGLVRRLKQSDPRYANLSIILRADRSMQYKDLSDFMKACSKAGIADVTFATLEGP